MTDARAFWDDVYRAKAPSEVSWYQQRPERSVELIEAFAPDRDSRIIDVGCGASGLLGELAALGYRHLAGLDASAVAIDKVCSAIGEGAGRIAWFTADITAWIPDRKWDLWHDRAVCHFLTLPAQQDAYVRAISAALDPGARAIIATFAPDGPERCSGLPVQRYDAAALAARLGAGFALLAQSTERHVTPKGVVQSFAYAVLERR